jgi:hypothetical protein
MNIIKTILLLFLATAVQAAEQLILRDGEALPEESTELEPNQGGGPRCSMARATELCPNSAGCQGRATKFAIARGNNGFQCVSFPAVCAQIERAGKECYVMDDAASDSTEPVAQEDEPVEELSEESAAEVDLEPKQPDEDAPRCTFRRASELCPASAGCQGRPWKFAIARANGSSRCVSFAAVCAQIEQAGKECFVEEEERRNPVATLVKNRENNN